MQHKCPVCEEHTLHAGYDTKQDINFFVCQNEKCEDYLVQKTDVEVEQ